ncbi:hypothetical protein NliqN6_1384 [Naganishia liquefaciens]|uniref:Uncharacterized protein n=1 Tax=Naganishia liquefaciens TaxID=104408 RepID=A0A8H3TPT1_9TREE|nr:hypothetical protein NliqN6_1384 [Naganishia liquefaciens]
MFNLNNMSTPAIIASRRKPPRPPIPQNLSYFSQSDSETDEEAEQESLGFPRLRYSRHGRKVPDLRKAMLSNLSLADLLPRTKGNNANHTVPINSPIPISGYDTTTSVGVLKHDGELSAADKLGSPIRLQTRRQDPLRSPTPTGEAHVPNPLTLSELRQLRSTANTTFHDAKRFGTPPSAQTPLSGVSRPVTPRPARSPMRSETPLQRRKPVPVYLDTAFFRDQTETTPSCAILSDGQSTPPGRFASHVYAYPSASHSLGALKLYDGSPVSPEVRAPLQSSYSTKDSISSSSFFSVSSTVSTEEHCRSSLESVEQGGEVRRNDWRVEDQESPRSFSSPRHRGNQNFVLSVDAPLPCRRTSAAESLGRQLMSACASTPVLINHSQTRITTQSERTSKIGGPDHAARFKLSWGKFRRNF